MTAKACGKLKRDGIPVFTIEVRRYYSSEPYLLMFKSGTTKEERAHNALVKEEYVERALELQAHADAIRHILLERTP